MSGVSSPLPFELFFVGASRFVGQHCIATDPTHWVLDVGALSPNLAALKELSISLLPTTVLDPAAAIGIYVKHGVGWSYRGMIHNGHPSEVIPLQWPEPDTPLPAGSATPPGFCQLGFSMEAISELGEKETSKVSAGEDFAKAVALNLFHYIESFGSGGRAGDALIMPTDVINRWFVKFSERYRRDPDFFTRSVSKV